MQISDDRPPFSFVQYVNDPAGYCWVKCDEELSEDYLAELEQSYSSSPEANEDDEENYADIVEIEPIPINGEVISLEEAEALWRDGSGALLVVERPPDQLSPDKGAYRSFEPLRHFRSLFRSFSELDPTPKSIQSFVERFGFLGDLNQTDDGNFELIVPELYGDDQPIHGEGILFWVNEIALMRNAIDYWRRVSDRDEEGLSQFVKWNNGVVEIWSDLGNTLEEPRLIFEFESRESEMFGFIESDVLGPARFICSAQINMGLEGRVSPRLVHNPPHYEPTLEIVPSDLLGAMWLQLAQAVDGNREYRSCENCGIWFEIGSGAYSRARRFCSNRCRVAASRVRKRAEEGGES